MFKLLISVGKEEQRNISFQKRYAKGRPTKGDETKPIKNGICFWINKDGFEIRNDDRQCQGIILIIPQAYQLILLIKCQ